MLKLLYLDSKAHVQNTIRESKIVNNPLKYNHEGHERLIKHYNFKVQLKIFS